MKKIITLFSLTVLLLISNQDAHAQLSLGAQGSYNLDAFSEDGAESGTYSLGGQARLGLAGLPVLLNPGVDYYFTGMDGLSVMQFDANVLYPIGGNTLVFTPYVGAGLGVTRVSFDSATPIVGNLVEDSETDFGVNLLGGATFGTGAIQPFVQARITLGEHLAFVNENGEKGAGYALMGGLLFRLGQ